jgi:signal transduction histidine kinase
MHGVRHGVGQRDGAVDGGIAAAVLLLTLTQLGTSGVGRHAYADGTTEADGLALLLALLTAAPVLWRRSAPLSALLVTMAAGVALTALGYPVHVHGGPAAVLYTLGERADRRQARTVAPIALAGFATLAVLGVADVGLSLELDDHLIEAILWGGAWLAGDRRRLALDRTVRERRVAVAEERERIARELHDSAGHAINAILLQAAAARLTRERDPENAHRALETVEEVARETIEDLDRLVGNLRDGDQDELAPAPGLAQIDTLVERHRSAGLTVTSMFDGSPRRLAAVVDRGAYRIAQEALTNACRHGEGSACVRVAFGHDALELIVTNPVAPHTRPREGGGRGIVGMRERAALLGGVLDVRREGATFRVLARLPYQRTAVG